MDEGFNVPVVSVPDTVRDVAVTAFNVVVADVPVWLIFPAVVIESAVSAFRVAVPPVCEMFPLEVKEDTVVPNRVVDPDVCVMGEANVDAPDWVNVPLLVSWVHPVTLSVVVPAL
jgi:hypothetical protein